MNEVEVLTHIDYLIDMAQFAGSVHAKPARAELAALRARADEVTALQQAMNEARELLDIWQESFSEMPPLPVTIKAVRAWLAAHPAPEQVTP